MENTTTRIADLPEGIEIGRTDNVGKDSVTNYTALNIHPNPYGNSGMNPTSMPAPQQTTVPRNTLQVSQQIPPPQSQYLSEDQIQKMQNQRIPSRDIHHDTTSYIQDEEVTANYIPRANISSDYVRDYQHTTEKNLREYEDKKNRENKLDRIIHEFQTPILIAILFFLFQMPIVNSTIFNKFPFLTLINEDGNFNISGLLIKSTLFGVLYYVITKGSTFISEF
jgi:Fe2+ transport system protein B